MADVKSPAEKEARRKAEAEQRAAQDKLKAERQAAKAKEAERRAENEKAAAERKAARDKEAQQKATADKGAADKAAAEKEAAAKKQAQQQPAKKEPPKKPSPYAPFNLVGEFTNNKQVCGARFSPCGNYVVAGGMVGAIYRWDATKEFAAIPDLTGHGGWIQALAFAPGSTKFFSGDSWGRLRAWDAAAADDKPLWKIDDAHASWVRQLTVSQDGKLVATAGRDGFVRLWDAATGKKIADLAGHDEDVYSVAFSTDGKTLASGDFMGRIKLWSVAEKKQVGELDGKQFAALERLQDCGGVRILQFTPDGKTLIAAGTEPVNGGTVQGYPTLVLFDLAAAAKAGVDKAPPKPTKTFKFGETKEAFVTDVVQHPGGYLIVSTSGVVGNGKLLLLKMNEDKPYVETIKFSNVHAVSMHPDGRRILLTSCNGNNSGNGAVKSKENMEYASNWSPLRVVELPGAEPTA